MPRRNMGEVENGGTMARIREGLTILASVEKRGGAERVRKALMLLDFAERIIKTGRVKRRYARKKKAAAKPAEVKKK